jgi:hypothetical protein
VSKPPIFIRCEGAGAESQGWCPMCAIYVPRGLTIPDHDRLDVLAMIDRGDFRRR